MSKIFVAMIPARLGSKRIPKKNIRYMGDKPLIEYPIDLALSSERFESVWINTESEELGRYIEKLGAGFHKRPAELAGDTATNRDFTYEFMQKHECDYVIMINSTSPLLRQETLNRFMEYVASHDFDTVLSVITTKEETFYQGKPLNFSLAEKVNSQFLEPTEAICWALTAWKRDTFMTLQEKGINPVFGGKVGRFAIPKDESCDLDTPEDWNIAEGILNSRIYKYAERYMEL
ncbi:MAG: acylneuraminate cytidylyltransferase family protein [Blautia sp.]|nr:acylneuraminate cytidylyltransferase family protein [Blautia sp.]MCM1201374.1 acylneuraminate cytidylyltransferase family protein [Bacteroides fragilis]